MEQMPHHREGIQNDLDKAYDEGHRDNEAFDDKAKIRAWDEAGDEAGAEAKIADKEIESQLSVEEKARVAGEEKEISPELAETIARLKHAGYLDASFEGKEVHELVMRALSKEEALAEYKTSGGKTWVWDELEKDMPYFTPKAESRDVMIMNFSKTIQSDKAVVKMEELGVRPLTYEELIQYGTAHPSHQQGFRWLVGLGGKHYLPGDFRAPYLQFDDTDGRGLTAGRWPDFWGVWCRFPVVPK